MSFFSLFKQPTFNQPPKQPMLQQPVANPNHPVGQLFQQAKNQMHQVRSNASWGTTAAISQPPAPTGRMRFNHWGDGLPENWQKLRDAIEANLAFSRLEGKRVTAFISRQHLQQLMASGFTMINWFPGEPMYRDYLSGDVTLTVGADEWDCPVDVYVDDKLASDQIEFRPYAEYR